MTVAMRRYPLEPLLRAAGYEPWDTADPQRHTVEVIAQAAGITPRQVHRWAREGVPDDAADRVAVKLAGRTPCEVWPEWGEVQVEAESPTFWQVGFTCPTCGTNVRPLGPRVFVPEKGQRRVSGEFECLGVRPHRSVLTVTVGAA